MADSEETLTLEEIRNMKVVDLKRELKNRALPTSGNKTELVERLQEAVGIPKDLSEASVELDDSLIQNDEDEILEDDALFNTDSKPANGAGELNEDEILDTPIETEPPVKISQMMTPVTATLAASAAAPIATDVDLDTSAVEPPKDVTVPVSSEEDKEKTADSENSKAVPADVKKLTLEERKLLRAKKFNLPLPTGEKLKVRSERFGAASPGNSAVTTAKNNPKFSKSSIVSNVPPVNLELLKKRAERFGQNVSTRMKTLEEKEKLLKRKERFDVAKSSSASEAKKARTIIT